MIIIDVETTGINPNLNSILSLGAVEFDTDLSFYGECCIYPYTVVDPTALAINGFTEEQIQDKSKPLPHELYWNFLNWVKNSANDKNNNLLCGHNIGHFDILFLEKLHQYLPGSIKFPFSYRTVDIHSVGYSVLNESLKLDQLGEKLGLGKEPTPHNALNGAVYGKSVLKKLLQHKISFEEVCHSLSTTPFNYIK